jgi:acetyltransferase-like isoleucine patch superfamily enzyme
LPARFAYTLAMGVRRVSMPAIPGIHSSLYRLRLTVLNGAEFLLRTLWYTPLFQSRLETPAPGLFLYSGIPFVTGPVSIRIGGNCRISGMTTISGRTAPGPKPQLFVGSNCDIGWQTTIAVGTTVRLGDNVRIAGRAFLAGYPGHPLDPAARAAGAAEEDSQARDIVLEDDVWLATGVTVTAGVRIGRATVVAANSVVTKDLPPGVLAGGAPAKVIRKLIGLAGNEHI